MALADERSSGRSVAPSLLATTSAVADRGVAGSGDCFDARAAADGWGTCELTAQVRDAQFRPAANAHVTVHIVGPEGMTALVDLTPSQNTPGQYQTEWTAEKPGTYLAEVTAESADSQPQELGRDVVTFQRKDGVAENFHTEQNRRLLEQLASETGGRYWKPSDLENLPRDISYSEAGISVRSTKELWDMPIVFLLLLGLPIGEWLLRRKWGVI